MKKKVKRLIRLLLADEGYIQPALFYDEQYTAKEKRQARKAFESSMWAEIIMLRTVMKRYFAASRQRKEANDVSKLAEDLRLLGTSCMRLARVMQVNQALQDACSDKVEDSINSAVQAVLAEFGKECGDQLTEVYHE